MSRRPLCLAGMLVVLWIIVMKMAGMFEETSLPDSLKDKMVKVQGQVYRQEKSKNLLYLKNIMIISNNEESEFSDLDFNILVYTKEETDYKIGNTIAVSGNGMEPTAASNPGQFDQKAYYRVQGIRMIVKKAKTVLLDDACHEYLEFLAGLREAFGESLSLSAGEADGAVLSAMIVGDKAEMEAEVKKLYQAAGISHILAISGLHISLIGMGLYRCLRKIIGGFWLPGSISTVMMISYIILTGGAVSAIRAVIMFLVYLGAQLLGRTYDLLSGLSLAGILILLSEPRYLFQAGFQLSFLAIVGICIVYPVLCKLFLSRDKKSKIGENFMVSLSIQIVTLPCVLFWFYEFAVCSVVVNLLVIPLAGIVMASGIAAGAVGLLTPTAGAVVAAPAHYVLMLYEKVGEWSEKLTGRLGVWGAPDGWKIILYYGVLAGILAMTGFKKIPINWKSKVIYIFIQMSVLSLLWFRPVEGMTVTFLDVGQGDSIFWQNPNGNTYLCDGGSSGVSKVGEYRIEPFLKWNGTARLDYLFVTHMDADHISGIQEMLESHPGELDIGQLVLPTIVTDGEAYQELVLLAEQKQIPVLYLKRGDILRDGEVTVRCLWPIADTAVTKDRRNENSMVLYLEYGALTVLLTGDLEKDGEEAMIREGSLGEVMILKAGHHGSNGATGKNLLECIKPKAAVLSYGADNTYGHPHAEVLERLHAAGGAVYETAVSGAVIVKSDGEEVEIRGFMNVP